MALGPGFQGGVSLPPYLPPDSSPQLLEYLGKGKSIVDVGLAQARHPLSTRSHYFEVEIVDPGEKCYIALGLARKVGTSAAFARGAAQLGLLGWVWGILGNLGARLQRAGLNLGQSLVVCVCCVRVQTPGDLGPESVVTVSHTLSPGCGVGTACSPGQESQEPLLPSLLPLQPQALEGVRLQGW